MEYLYWIYHYDARGSATNLVGAKNGSLYRAEENIYDAFGNKEELKQSTSSVVNDIKFTGATLDNSGTYYLGSRHYDPNTGRFLQQDTFKGEAYSPWTQNLYTYTSNNPVNYVDPTGHFFKEIGIAVGVIIGLVCGGKKGAKAGAQIGGTIGTAVDKALGFGKSTTQQKKTGNSVVDSNQHTSQNRGRGYNNRDEAINQMNILLKDASVENGFYREYGAFVYEYEGMFYVSSLMESSLDKDNGAVSISAISAKQVENEYAKLGLLKSGEKIDFSHTHLRYDEHNGGTKPAGEYNKKYTYHTSSKDINVLNAGTMNTVPLRSFATLAPLKEGSNYFMRKDPETIIIVPGAKGKYYGN